MSMFLASALIAAPLVGTSSLTAAQSVGGDEAAIKRVVETLVKAVNKAELNTLLAHLDVTQ